MGNHATTLMGLVLFCSNTNFAWAIILIIELHMQKERTPHAETCKLDMFPKKKAFSSPSVKGTAFHYRGTLNL